MNIGTRHERVYYRFEEIVDGEAGIVDRPSTAEPEVTEDAWHARCTTSRPSVGFWRRQFGTDITSGQRKFDWVIGVLLPLICFYFDPFVFRSWIDESGFLHDYKLFAYSLAFTSIMAMSAWLLWGERLKWICGGLAGIFLAGSVVSLVVGAVLFPISLVGLVFLIGLLGFTPLFSSIVYMRNGVRALRTARPHFENKTLGYFAAIVGMASIIVPFVIHKTFMK